MELPQFDQRAQYLRSKYKVQYEHILIEQNQSMHQILDKICDLEAPLLYVYTVYERPQVK